MAALLNATGALQSKAALATTIINTQSHSHITAKRHFLSFLRTFLDRRDDRVRALQAYRFG